MSADIKCDECKVDIDTGEETFCLKCIEDIKRSLELAQQEIADLEEKLKGKEEGR